MENININKYIYVFFITNINFHDLRKYCYIFKHLKERKWLFSQITLSCVKNYGKKIEKQIGLVILKEKHDLTQSNYLFCYYNLLKVSILQQNQPLSPNQARRIRNSNPMVTKWSCRDETSIGK